MTTTRINASELAATVTKIQKINDRAAMKGLTGFVTVSFEKVIVPETIDGGFQVEKVYYDTTISGDAPSYNGWKFLARVDVLESGTIFLANAPGVDEVISTENIRPKYCTHCKTTRYRKASYVVRNEAGQMEVVGSTCIKDFLGWTGTFSFQTESDIKDDLEESFGGRSESVFSVDSILGLAWAATKTYGYVPKSVYDGRSTYDVVSTALWGAPKSRRETLEALAPLAEFASERAAETRAFILSDDFRGESNYVTSMKNLMNEDFITAKHLGFIVSAPAAWIRAQTTDAERAAKAAQREAEAANRPVSNFVGEVGDKVVLDFSIKAITYHPHDYGVSTLYIGADAEGNEIKWFASRSALGDDAGVTVHISCKIKKHEEYKGRPQTKVQRCALTVIQPPQEQAAS